MSGYEPQNPGREEDREEEPVVFFRKPFTGAALLDKVRQILDASVPMNSTKSEKESENSHDRSGSDFARDPSD